MTNIKRPLQLLIHLTSLAFGGLIYVCFRSTTLEIFKWMHYLNISKVVEKLRVISMPYKPENYDWVIFSLPDGLWTFSLTTILLYIWDNEISEVNILWLLLTPAIAISSEILQKYKFINGTYDQYDIIAYISGFILPILMFSKNQTNYI